MGSSLGHALAQLAGGNVDARHDEGPDIEPTLSQDAQSLLPQLEAGARGGREHREAAQFGALVPPRQREGRVGADDEDELHPRQLLAQLAQRVHGVGDAGALYLQGAHGEGGVAGHGGGHHGQPHLAGGHEDDPA